MSSSNSSTYERRRSETIATIIFGIVEAVPDLAALGAVAVIIEIALKAIAVITVNMVKKYKLSTLDNLTLAQRGAYDMILTKISASPTNIDPDQTALAATNQGIHQQLYASLTKRSLFH